MNPKTLLPVLLSAGFGITSIHAQVTLTFDTDLQGFTQGGDATLVEWSAENGGSMLVSAAGGWAGNCASLEMPTNAAFFDEMKLAETNGGTLSFDVIVRDANVDIPADPPGWFEMVIIANSAAGWDQSVKGLGIGGGDWPLDPAERIANVSIPVFGESAAVDDGNYTIDTSGGWGNVHLGLNNDGNDLANGGDTTGVNTEPGSITVYIDNLTIEANQVATPPPTLEIKPATRGLNLIAASTGIYDRRMVRTTDVANSWIGVATEANPVTYAITVKESLPQGFETFIYFVPSIDGAEIPDYSDPDWQASHCLRMTLQRDTAGEPGASGSAAYKVNSPDSNGPAGSEYWVNDATVPSTGLGGTLAYVGGADIDGTWSLTFTSDTDFTISAPDGTSTAGAMLPATAALFDADLHVYFGNLPLSEANLGLGTIYSNITISGIDFFVDENFTDLIVDGIIEPDAFLQVVPEGRSGVFVVTDETDYWLQWSLPAPGYLLEQSVDLGEPGPWETMLMDKAVNVGNSHMLLLLDSLETLDPDANYFRMAKPDVAP
jgi:hypothetical protein